jgi:hypothetical protein
MTETDSSKRPYHEEFGYTALGGLTSKSGTLWDYSGGWSFSYTKTNNRVSGETYDYDGDQQTGGGATFDFDGAKQMFHITKALNYETNRYFDGVGTEGKRSLRDWSVPDDTGGSWNSWSNRYFIYSTVLRTVLTEADDTGKKRRTYVIGQAGEIARQGVDGTTQTVGWQSTDPSGYSTRTTYNSLSGSAEADNTNELDAFGNNVGAAHLSSIPSPVKPGLSGFDKVNFTDPAEGGEQEVDGILMPSSLVSNSSLELQYKFDEGGGIIDVPLNPDDQLPGGGYLVDLGYRASQARDVNYGDLGMVTVGVTPNLGMNQPHGPSQDSEPPVTDNCTMSINITASGHVPGTDIPISKVPVRISPVGILPDFGSSPSGTFNHLYVTLQDNKEMIGFRAGPEDGVLKAEEGAYINEKNFPDFEPNRDPAANEVYTNTDCRDLAKKFGDFVFKVNKAKIAYEVLSTNSNAFIYSMLKDAGLNPDSFTPRVLSPRSLHPVFVPGWGTTLEMK